MKKVFDQTVRDLKRGVNKKVLKVPSIEQKVLDSTSNEPWGPHGSLLADIAQATRNYNEYQMIMSVIWKRINDTGKNWRHVYKALTVLEYLVAHGSERVIDEIKEHSYQISTLSDFQYVDSSGRDQGSNVRKKSQSLVALVNDKERIQEVRQKAATNREKYRNTSTGSMYRPGSYSNSGGYADRYDEDRNGARDDREREWGRDEDKYGRYGGDGDRYGRDSDGYKDDDYSGRNQSDEYHSGSRSRSSDRERENAYDDDAQYSSRGGGARAEDQTPESASGGGLERKYSEQNIGAPPSYEEAVGTTVQSPPHVERDGETSSVHAPPKSPSVHSSASPAQETTVPAAPIPENKDISSFDEFDPRASFAAASTGIEMDLLGSLSDSFPSNTLALVPADNPPRTTSSESTTFAAASPPVANQAFDDPFGDGPFKASNDIAAPYNIPYSVQSPDVTPPAASHKVETLDNLGGTLSTAPLHSFNQQYGQQELSSSNQEIDILADILPPSGQSPTEFQIPPEMGVVPLQASQHASQMGFSPQTDFASQNGPTPPDFSGQPGQASVMSFSGQPSFQTGQSLTGPAGFLAPPAQAPHTGFTVQSGQPASHNGSTPPDFYAQPGQASMMSFSGQASFQTGQSLTGPAAFLAPPAPAPPLTGFTVQSGFPHAGFDASGGQSLQPNASFYGGYSASQVIPQSPQIQINASPPSMQQPIHSSSASSLTTTSQPAKDKFATKSTVWADTLNRGLVNLNISGPKTNPLADIGVDFDAINRKDKRMEKPTASPMVSSTITMGKAMGSGSGIGRSGASAIRPAQNPTVGPGMGMGMGMGMGGPGAGFGMGNLRGVNPPMGMGMNTQMNMGVAPGMHMQQPTGFPPGSTNVPGTYNPMTGTHSYYGQQPYGGGYR